MLRWLRPLRRLPRRLVIIVSSPVAQVLAALGGVIGGAALIGRIALGVAVIFASMLILADGLWRDDARTDRRRTLRSVHETHETVLENYRRAP